MEDSAEMTNAIDARETKEPKTRTVRKSLGKTLAILLAATLLVGSPILDAQIQAQGSKPSAATPATGTAASNTGTAAGTGTTATGAVTAPTSGPAAGQADLLDPAAASRLEINAKAYVLYEAESDTFLLGRNADQPLSPASITKVMTVLLALENLSLDDTITITKDMYATIPNDYVRLGLTEGEVITVEHALYASMLISANDTATALAFKMGGTAAGFAAMMNEKAAQLGCTNTTFTNPYGLAEATNLTTAADMARILSEALRNPTFRKLATTKQLLLPATNKAGTRGLSNGNRFVSTTRFAYAPYIGGKTGFTNMSGHTIVAGASKDGRTLIGVILGATASEIRYANLITLFDHGFASYSTVKLEPASYDDAKAQLVSRVEKEIKDSGMRLTVAGTSLKLDPYATTTKDRNTSERSYTIGEPGGPIQAVQSIQALDYPLYVEYKDGARSRVGTLSVTLQPMPTSASPTASAAVATSSGTTAAAAVPAPGTGGNLLLRILGIVLAIVVLAAIVIFILMRRELNRRNRRRRSGSRRL